MERALPPPEWAPHKAVWIGFPSHPDLWEADLEPARAEVTAFARAVHADGRGERVLLVVADEEAAKAARRMAGDFADIVIEPFGDIWLRDTGPIMLNDGTALIVTTEQCLLNPNRNPGLSRGEIEQRLHDDLGFTEVLWLGEGLAHDHTDGHVDNLARFVAPGRLAIPEPAENDPNWLVYTRAAHVASAREGVEIARLPSPGRVLRDEEIVPASYMNFYIGNAAVVVPLYGAPNDEAAVAAVQALFPDRAAVGLRADAILTGGGSFHCISQQVPA